jgi:hypothetical protein
MEVEILDEGQPGDAGDGDTGRADGAGPSRVWLHRSEYGVRIVWDAVHPEVRPADCPGCSLFVEAPNGGRP